MSEIKKTKSGEIYQLSGKEVCAALVMFVGLKNGDPATSAIHSVGADGYKYSWRSTEFGAELRVEMGVPVVQQSRHSMFSGSLPATTRARIRGQ